MRLVSCRRLQILSLASEVDTQIHQRKAEDTNMHYLIVLKNQHVVLPAVPRIAEFAGLVATPLVLIAIVWLRRLISTASCRHYCLLCCCERCTLWQTDRLQRSRSSNEIKLDSKATIRWHVVSSVPVIMILICLLSKATSFRLQRRDYRLPVSSAS